MHVAAVKFLVKFDPLGWTNSQSAFIAIGSFSSFIWGGKRDELGPGQVAARHWVGSHMHKPALLTDMPHGSSCRVVVILSSSRGSSGGCCLDA
jgi:hypothetical protein